MDSKLRAFLSSLSPAARAVIVEKLGDLAVETAEEKELNVVRLAAGLQPLDVDPNEGTNEDPTAKVASAARKAAGLK